MQGRFICTDIWSKKGMMAAYLGISAHFFSRLDHQRHTVTRGYHHPTLHITTHCVRSLQSGKYQRNKINAILTDSGSNMIKAFWNWLQAIHEEEEEEEKELSNDPQAGSVAFSLHERFSCFSCILKLVMCKFNTITSPTLLIAVSIPFDKGVSKVNQTQSIGLTTT